MIYTTLDTFYVSHQQMLDSPSRRDGVDENVENLLRIYGCEIIQECGILLKLPQAVMATGQVLFHRFYCKKSFTRFNVKSVAASCVWLAAKLEESPKEISAVLQVLWRMERRRNNLPIEVLDLNSPKYLEMKTALIRTERHLLKEMGFICHVEHPHKFIMSYLKALEAPVELMQEAWNLANDSLRTSLCVRFKSEVVACGVVYAAARRFKVPLPDRWWEVFDAKWSDVQTVCKVLATLYKQPKAGYIEVGQSSKSFVLASKAWDCPLDTQGGLVKKMTNGAAPVHQVLTTLSSDGGVAKDPTFIEDSNRTKSSTMKNGRKDLEEVRGSTSNGELRGDALSGKEKPANHLEDGAGHRSREEEWDRSKLHKREIDRDLDAERERDRSRLRGREQDRERLREKDKERGRESGKGKEYRHKERSRDLERDSELVREKDRHRHHQNV
ncbi:unnamed protein product [Sphagnum troendelagicum]|uniref:Cyclin-like domain-containing protein n=1 Tax=Sphagnum troendelagicum TaxID=128251 RepID=A0ABP0U676_9BRYO